MVETSTSSNKKYTRGLPCSYQQPKCNSFLLQESSQWDYNHEEDVQQTEDSCFPGKILWCVPHDNARNCWRDT